MAIYVDNSTERLMEMVKKLSISTRNDLHNQDLLFIIRLLAGIINTPAIKKELERVTPATELARKKKEEEK